MMMEMNNNNTKRRTTTATASSERKNNRGKIQIMGDVLALGTSGIKKTHIMYKANLSYEQVHLYLGELIAKRLIAQDASSRSSEGVVYRTTEKGREFLQYYTRLTECLEGEEEEGEEVVVDGRGALGGYGEHQARRVEVSAPYIGRW
jgi:predicted transcriptional regulator